MESVSQSLGMMAAPPEDAAECDRIGTEMWIGLTLRYQQIAAARDIELLRKPPSNPDSDCEYLQALKRFDEYILDQFTEWGWRMLLSKEVVRILARWEARHPELLERFGDKLALKSRIFGQGKPAPLLQGVEEFADVAIAELQRLLHMQRDEFRQRRGPQPTCERIAEWLKRTIEARPADFPCLHAHLGQLYGYVKHYLPTRNPKLARILESGEMRGDSFFIRWFATATNRSIKDVQNQLSLRRRQALQRLSQK